MVDHEVEWAAEYVATELVDTVHDGEALQFSDGVVAFS